MTEKRRLRGRRYSRSDIRILEYLVELSAKHGINATEFFNAIVFAWSNGKAICRELTVKFRKKKKDCAVFLITKDYAVLAQLPIPENILQETNPLEGFDYIRERVRNASIRKERKTLDNHHIHIKDLEAGMKKINLKARVIGLSKPKQVVTRFNNYAVVTNATLSDETSTIKLPLWNGQINMLSINDQVQIENANVGVFQGKKQLRIGRNSKLKIIESRSLKNQ